MEDGGAHKSPVVLAARQRLESRFSWNTIARSYVELYESLPDQRGDLRLG